MNYNPRKDSKRITTFDTASNIFLSFPCLGRKILGSRLLYNKRYQTYNALRSDRRPNDRASGLVERIDERLQDLGVVHVGPQGNCYLLHLQFVFLLNNSVFLRKIEKIKPFHCFPKMIRIHSHMRARRGKSGRTRRIRKSECIERSAEKRFKNIRVHKGFLKIDQLFFITKTFSPKLGKFSK